MKMKKVVAVVMALALALINPFTVSDAKAANYSAKKLEAIAEDYDVQVVADEEKTYSYDVNGGAQEVGYLINTASPVDVDVVITNSVGTELASKTYLSTDSNWLLDEDGTYCCPFVYYHKTGGTYNIKFKFKENTSFNFVAYIDKPDAKINLTKATITAGFKRKLSVTGGKVKTWKTSDKNVAVVDKNGNVTAKKVGNCTITAELTSGKKLTCKVSVKKNAFYAKKGSNSDGYPGVFYANPYYAEYNSKGDLVLKVRIINNTYQKIAKFKNIKIQVKNPSGKLIGTYSASSKNVSIPSYTCKDLTFVIKKANLKIKIKKADLRNSTVKVLNFDGYYYRYY